MDDVELSRTSNIQTKEGHIASDECESMGLNEENEEEGRDEMFVPRRRPPNLHVTCPRTTMKKSFDIERYLSFDIDDEEETKTIEKQETPINVYSYFCDEPSVSPAIEIVSPQHNSCDENVKICSANDNNNVLRVPTTVCEDDDELTDAEYSDSEREKDQQKKRLSEELSAIGSGFTSAYGFYKVEDEVEEEEKKEERIIGKVTVPRLFNVVEEVMKPIIKERVTKEYVETTTTTTREMIIDEIFKEEAIKYGKCILPRADEHEIIIFDKVSVPR